MYFQIISLKKIDKWRKNSTKPFVLLATHFDVIHQIRFLKLDAKNKNQIGQSENETTSLFSLLRKTVQHNVYNHGPVLIEIENMS